MLIVVVGVAAVDQLVKQWMLNNLEPGVPVPVLGDWFRLFLLFNPGAAFGMGENATWLFTTIQLVFVIGVLIAAPFMRDKGTAVGLALIGGGALGNLVDRLFREPGFWFGHVVDFISIGDFAVFNIADASISVGVGVFVLAMVLDDKRQSDAEKSAQKQEAEGAGDGSPGRKDVER
ncbi:MAG: signal peptidase II [Corynebacterium sp.]|nr:signal peptidase II [Corynebacterium sp.]